MNATSQRFVAKGSVQGVVELDGAFLLEIEAGQCFLLNGVGASVWRALDVRRSLDELVTIVCVSYPDAERSVIERDVKAFLEALSANQLVEQVTS